MEKLFSPWRSHYIQSFKSEDVDEKRCVFCDAHAADRDEETLVLYRGRSAFVIMNRFPYNSGHLMVIPNRHSSDFQSLSGEESLECIQLLQMSQAILSEVVRPHAFNLGMNLGRTAGAGIDDHFHWHIVPRWNGDTNFLPVLADVKLVSEDMGKLWRNLRAAFDQQK